MRIMDWSSDVCSSDLLGQADGGGDFIVFGKDGFARFLVPEGGEEIVEVAREQRRGVGGKPARHVLVAHDPDAVLLADLDGDRAYDIAALFAREMDDPASPPPRRQLPVRTQARIGPSHIPPWEYSHVAIAHVVLLGLYFLLFSHVVT